MRLFACACGARVFFENSQCLACGHDLGFVPEVLDMATFDAGAPESTNRGQRRKCENYAHEGVCNWLLPAESQDPLCQACELNRVIPNLAEPENRSLWVEVEKAKRRLVYGLACLKLPIVPKSRDAEHGLAFDIKAEMGDERVLTGHSDGLITLALREADPAEREQIRLQLRERYRTVLGHFRHEVGHYYWDRLVRDGGALSAFRDLFGDESVDYAAALKRHYASSQQLQPDFISSYAAAHPWEDFAETFAHYLHMVDTLETAGQFGFTSPALQGFPGASDDLAALLAEWTKLSVALNSLNRSMGAPDAYPFAISPRVAEKLGFIHRLVGKHSQPAVAQ
jgi:hypothetical protein